MPIDEHGKQYHITLDVDDVTYGFMLLPGPAGFGKLDVSDFAPRVASGDLGYRDLSVWQVWAQEDWRHGFGVPTFKDESAYARTGSGVDTRHKDIIMLATEMTSSDTGVTVNKFVDFNSKVYAGKASNGGVRVYTPGTDTWAASTGQTTGTVLDMLSTGDYLVISLDGARMRKMNTSGTWSNVGNDGNAPEDMNKLCLHGGYFWCSEDGNNWLHRDSQDDLSELEGDEDTDTDAIQVGPGDVPIVNLISYGGQLYVAREDGLWVIAEDDSPRLILEFSQERHSNNFKTMAVWRGHMYFSIRHRLYRYTGSTLLDVTPPRYNEEFPYYTYGNFDNLTPRGDFLYVTARDTESSYHESLLAYDGVGWHKLWDVVDTPYSVTCMNLSTVTDRLWLNYSGTSAVSAYIPLQGLSDLPYADFQTTGTHYWYSSKFDAGFKDVDKVFWKMRVRSNNCSATQEVHVAYDIDDSGTWTSLDDVTASPYQEIDFPDPDSFTTYGKQIQLRFDLQTDDGEQSPIIEAFSVLYLLRPDAVWGWQLSVGLASSMRTLDGGREREITAQDLVAVLEDARDQRTPITFTDMWGAEHEVYLSALKMNVTEWRPGNDEESIELVARLSLTDASSG